jgi:hemolysin III
MLRCESGTERIRIRFIKEPFCGLSHLAGAVISLAGLIVLLVLARGQPWQTVSFAIYGTCLILLFTASGLSHSIRCSTEREGLLDRLDYAAIFLLIAGTYTPICLVNLRGPWGWSLFAAEWTLAIIGVCTVLVRRWQANRIRVMVYLLMGWLVLIAVPVMVNAFPPGAIAWLIAGGLVYSIGAIVYLSDRPHLWPGRFHAHDLWHSMVLIGSACHFIVMARYVA